ncbi:hypothetical protein B0T16DRAFT_450689 [Cercophora newfieldiana]|uniref:Uncharacterized protein n=1 Tax=Cercophora newfieldiana TaxID=92897 RepID=A0AA39YNP6_9PEZI|nr:hypothetical protein B0T16DRAFT_450689 [Cercophora newfieldiana]
MLLITAIIYAFLYYIIPHILATILTINWDAKKVVNACLWLHHALYCPRHGIISHWCRGILFIAWAIVEILVTTLAGEQTVLCYVNLKKKIKKIFSARLRPLPPSPRMMP